MKIVRLLPILLLLCVSSLFAQSKIKIQGEVNVPFSSIRLFKGAALVTGTIGNEKGKFMMEVAPGVYDLLVESIGYEALKMTNQSFTSSTNLGIITVKESNQTLNEVVVKGQKASMELNLDKRIFNVGTDLANKGATASEILGNLPSIQVDPEGAIKLRGSDNVRILIDGKPSTLAGINGSSGLQSLQGNLIDKVEIITNPSARYEAEGMAGIINIVLKKNQNQGFNGAIETTTGYPENFGGTAIVNYRKNKFNFFINYGVFYRRTPGRGSIYQEVYTGKQTNILEQRSQNNVTGLVNNVRGGADYFFNDKTILTASYIFRRTDVQRITDFNYLDYRGNVFNLYSDTYRQQDEKEAEPNGEYALTFKKSFAKKGKEFSADLRYLDYWERSDQTYTQNGKKADGSVFPELSKVQKALNDEFERQWILQADYVNPIGKEAKIEMGVRTSFRNMINDYIVTEQQPSGVFTVIPGLRNVFNYKENISAAYVIFGNKMKQFSYQFGLRAETTDIQTELEQTGEKNPRNYANLFPSAHFTYTITPDNSFQLSYSRRVRRPTYNDLSPFVTFSDNRNFFSGNPNLNPEFTNSFDLGNVRYFDKGSVSSSLYYRHTLGKIDRFRSVDTSGFAKTLPVNLSDQQSMGIEIASSYTFTKAYRADLSINAFRAITDATNINAAFKSDTYSWFVRHSSRIKLGAVDFQVRANYEAPQQTPQGTRGYIAWADFSASKDILQGNGTLSLSILDLFSSRINRYESRFLEPTDGSGFYTRGESQGRLTSLNLTFNYRFKTTKQAAKQRRSLMDEEN
ncbi:TonB-dependent receptor family protein [Aquirufa antheringensis]|jgi:outer membrane receptor protein involved in Fe transport|uniref:TonB-dependent receptor family protein n=1 Tax=Aquirufa antheringensis TaxID=2516559 RepID=UPI001F954C2E|nr:TonB-dependent receptor family protein [Aquirufa antheringensis]MCE4216371.1 TonB-dependent receptor [Pseudarcicella sp. GAP-15]MCZ2486442.1 TonB-dependent receptor [Aquirufa antheringensis]